MRYRVRIVFCLLAVFIACSGLSQTVGNTHVVRLDSPVVADSVSIDEKYVQTFETLAGLEAEDYDELVIPPLAELLAAAEKSASVRVAEHNIDVARYELVSVRRQWMQWLKVHSSFSFGNSDMYAVQLLETTNQIWTYNQQQQQQMFWNVGASISIPISDIFTQGNKVRQQKARVRMAEAQREVEYQEVKNMVIKYYVDAAKQLNLFKVYAENYAAAESQYFVSEQDFINGEISIHDLFIMKNYQSGAKLEYEQCKASLNEALLCLEVCTGLPIISNMKKKISGEDVGTESEQKLDTRALRKLERQRKRSSK